MAEEVDEMEEVIGIKDRATIAAFLIRERVIFDKLRVEKKEARRTELANEYIELVRETRRKDKEKR